MGNQVENVQKTINRSRYGWTRWGGARDGFLMNNDNEWFCQACGKPQPLEMPKYILPLDDLWDDIVKVCSDCKHIQFQKRISYYQLIVIVKNQGDWH
jgi:hypothetical protein